MRRASSDNNKDNERNKQYTESEMVVSTRVQLTKVDGEQKATPCSSWRGTQSEERG